MKLIVTPIIILLVFISCQGNKKEDTTIKKEIINSNKNIEKQLNSYCFFKLDDKYSIKKDSALIDTWLKEKSLVIMNNDSIENIFSQNGGGPNGSQWNPSTDLYLAISTPSNNATEIPIVHINGKLYNKKVYTHNTSLIWYVVQQDFWVKEVTKIDSIAIKQMYSLELINGIKSGEFNTMAGLSYGDILMFEITYDDEKMTQFFHATYGE